ncbi:mechanosensitive ion channel family protein [Hyalangium rubrum]|uniref:Mechanosensitive ion channel n=1 Tax=Hyalangium rubrum TaxID=3103134 RepID=A0ABU5GUQ6_9BACT|nr:mechanosensitive ion channel domain-containing protein [Hyalangium sp. s54d21]MDY7224915.1 mechanosensitive ion channel [Hyalangium sp. s54d21]
MSHEWLTAFWAKHIGMPASWPFVLGVVTSIIVLGELTYRFVFSALHRFSQRTQTQLDDLLVRRMRLPARVLHLFIAFHAFLALRGIENEVVRTAVSIVELLLVAYLIIEALETFVLHYWLGERKGIEVPEVVRHLLLLVVYTVVVLSIVGSVTGINVIPVLATSTVVTVVLGLALQDTLGNLFAGLALHVEKPFGPGDWILVDGLEGQVVSMGWRSTHLRTFSWDVVVVPNSIIAKARLQNFYAPDKVCARNVEFLVRLDASPEVVERVARQACESRAEIRKEPAPKVWLVGMTPLFQRYVVKIWIDDFGRHDDIESDLLKALFRGCQTEGIALREGAVPALSAEAGSTAIVPAVRPR